MGGGAVVGADGHDTGRLGRLIGATGLMLLNQALKPLLPPRRPGESGSAPPDIDDRRGGGIVGFFVVPVVGGVLGYVGAIFCAERLRLGSRGAAWTSVRSVMRATGYAVLVELFCCLLVAGAWLGAVLWG